MVFQNYALFPHMTVYENLAFPLRVRKVEKDEIDKNDKALSMVSLSGFELECQLNFQVVNNKGSCCKSVSI